MAYGEQPVFLKDPIFRQCAPTSGREPFKDQVGETLLARVVGWIYGELGYC
jgi:hypothetical protein